MQFVLQILRKVYKKTFGFKKRGFFINVAPQYNGQESSDLIYNSLMSSQPCMISRLGNTEFSCVNHYKKSKGGLLRKYWYFVKGDLDDLEYSSNFKYKIYNNAGFFPPTNENLDEYSEMMLADIKEIDILGSIILLEKEFKEELKNAKTIGFEDLNPYYHQNPWSKALKGKNVLVIHPFDESIKSQFKRKQFLFKDQNVLPDFNLITYKPVLSIAGATESLKYKDWFEALALMKNDIDKIDYDIAIIGCGAYGLPLASHVKRMGKKAVHMGGSIQILFGIIGRRWETEYDMSNYFNEYWVRPLASEIPKNYKSVETGCYW